MGINQIFPTSLGARQLISFFDPSDSTNIVTPNLNPTVIKRKPNNLRKYTATTNSTSVILGAFEGPVSEISISYPMIDISQLEAIIPFTQLSPVVFVDNNDAGFYGVLVVDSCEQLNNYTRNVWALDMSFLVIGPYNGLTTTLPQLTAPTITATLAGVTGYIPNPATIYLWATVFTNRSADSESVVGSMTTISNTTPNAAYSLSWTPPSSLYFSKLRVYWNSTNNPVTATLLTECYSGFPSDVPNSFTLFNNYVAYNSESPVSYGTAFSGYWAGSIWIPVG